MMQRFGKLRQVAVFLSLPALAAGVLSSCGVQEDSSPRSLDVSDAALARDVSPSEAEPVSPDPSDEFLTIYFDRRQEGLNISEGYYLGFRALGGTVDRGQEGLNISEVLRFAPQPVEPEAIIGFLLEGPSEEEAEQGFVSYLPIPDDLLGTRVEDDAFVLNFRRGSRLEDLSGLQLYLAAGQLVLSLVANSSLEGIRVEIEGSPIALPSEEGDLLRPARREDYDDLLARRSFTLGNMLDPPPFPTAPETDENSDGALSEGDFSEIDDLSS